MYSLYLFLGPALILVFAAMFALTAFEEGKPLRGLGWLALSLSTIPLIVLRMTGMVEWPGGMCMLAGAAIWGMLLLAAHKVEGKQNGRPALDPTDNAPDGTVMDGLQSWGMLFGGIMIPVICALVLFP